MTKAINSIEKTIKATKTRRGIFKSTGIGYRNYSSRRRFSYLQLFLIVIFIGLAIWAGLSAGESSSDRLNARVVSVSDGDTIKVSYWDGQTSTIRLLGVDTPETHHPTKPVGCFGPEAENFSRQNLDGKEIELEFDVERNDKYGRTLAFVYLDGKRFNDVLVEKGFAKVLTISPNLKYSTELTQLQLDAQKKNIGLWGFCSNDL